MEKAYVSGTESGTQWNEQKVEPSEMKLCRLTNLGENVHDRGDENYMFYPSSNVLS